MIKMENGKFAIYSADGSKRLGEYDTQDEAENREKQVSSFGHKSGAPGAAPKMGGFSKIRAAFAPKAPKP